MIYKYYIFIDIYYINVYAFAYEVIVTLWHTVHIFSSYSEHHLCSKSTTENSQIDYF